MAGIVIGLVGGAIRAATGSSRDQHHDHIVIGSQPGYYGGSSCACHQPHCRLCTVDPAFMSRRELKRELKHERRALKHAHKAARKAARYGYALPVSVSVCHGHQQQAYPQQSYPQQQQGYQSVPPQQMQSRTVSQEPVPRRASFDEEDLYDEQPPKYEPGNEQRQQRRSVEVLTSDRKN